MSRTVIIGLIAMLATGRAVAQECDPNYSGPCVPVAPDVDCASGTGNGPA